MSTLARYRKPGGFRQLLMLVEGSGSAKREQLMKIIAGESKQWAEEINRRLLTAAKVFTWEVENVEKVLQLIPEQTWPKALFHLPEDQRAKLFNDLIRFQTQGKQKQLLDYMSSLKPTPAEVDAAHLFVVKKVRELQAAGEFRPERFDPNLSLDGLDKLVI